MLATLPEVEGCLRGRSRRVRKTNPCYYLENLLQFSSGFKDIFHNIQPDDFISSVIFDELNVLLFKTKTSSLGRSTDPRTMDAQ